MKNKDPFVISINGSKIETYSFEEFTSPKNEKIKNEIMSEMTRLLTRK